MTGAVLIIEKELVSVLRNRPLLAQLLFILAFSTIFPQAFAYSMIAYERVTVEKVLALVEIGKYYPLMIGVLFAAILAGESFAGERERRTIEVLAATPLNARSVLLGKFLFSCLVALALELPTFASFTHAVRSLAGAGGLGVDFPSSEYLLTCTALSWSLTILVTLVVIVASLLVRTKAAATTSAFAVLLPVALLITSASMFNVRIDDRLIIASSLVILATSCATLLLLLRRANKELMILGLTMD